MLRATRANTGPAWANTAASPLWGKPARPDGGEGGELASTAAGPAQLFVESPGGQARESRPVTRASLARAFLGGAVRGGFVAMIAECNHCHSASAHPSLCCV